MMEQCQNVHVWQNQIIHKTSLRSLESSSNAPYIYRYKNVSDKHYCFIGNLFRVCKHYAKLVDRVLKKGEEY